jgi:ABC-type uncharacterized transport system permease subunit
VIAEQSFTRQNPIHVYHEIFKAALQDRNGWGNVLYRATPLIFTGLAVALAVQCGLFNIGGEGQMVIGGFALTWVGFTFTGLPSILHIPLCVMAGMFAGSVMGGHTRLLKGHPWGTRGGHHHHAQLDRGGPYPVPDHGLQARGLLDSPHPQDSQERPAGQAVGLPQPHGHRVRPQQPGEHRHLLALLVVVLVWFILKKTKLGYEIRAVGFNPSAAECAGISVAKNTILAMGMSGALAGLAGVNQVMGYKHRFRYGVFEGLGFDGIGVAFIGRNSPFGVVLAALIFGILDQGGLAIDVSTKVPRRLCWCSRR